MKIEKYRDAAGELRARVVASNGKILFVTSESYKDERDLDNAIMLLQESADSAAVINNLLPPSRRDQD